MRLLKRLKVMTLEVDLANYLVPATVACASD
jgi:hypothetical protein